MRFVRLTVLSMVAVALGGGCSNDSKSADWLVYRGDGSRTVIVLMRTDGTGKFSPTDSVPGTNQTNPDWSPDGSRLVFALTDGATDDLRTVHADGTQPALLLDCAAPCEYHDDSALVA